MPEPGSRSSQARSASAGASTGPLALSGSSGAVMQTIALSISGSAESRSSVGGVPGDGDVGRVGEHALEHVLAVADVERQLDVRVLGGERAHERRDERLGRAS